MNCFLPKIAAERVGQLDPQSLAVHSVGVLIGSTLFIAASYLNVRPAKQGCRMGVGYVLVNRSRAQIVTFVHLPASTPKELAGNPVASAITTWYLLQNAGDEIAFVSDTDGKWPFSAGILADASDFGDVTDDVVRQLIDARILRDDGVAWADPDEPDSIYIRDLKNVWMD